jgi:ubiquinone/menaquinone biosynthesis C-methylase UbiE
MALTTEEWHRRFELQAQWTKSTRDYLFKHTGCSSASYILDVGCGTGAITSEIASIKTNKVIGIDLDIEFIRYAITINSDPQMNVADGHQLPFKNNSFDCTFCHYLLMWVSNPLIIIQEMKRVTSPGGTVLALAEPDYGGRIDYPEQLSILKEWQTTSLINQGANPFMGRKIKALFNQAGLADVEVGVIGAQWKGDTQKGEIRSEWDIIHSDLLALKNKSEVEKTADEIQKIDLAAWALGERILYVPTFFAWGKVR